MHLLVLPEFFIILLKICAFLVYPVGFSLGLITAGFVLLLLKKQKAAVVTTCSALVALFLFSYPPVAWVLLSRLEVTYLPQHEYPHSPAIVLLGGAGVAPTPPRIEIETNSNADRIFNTARLYKRGYADYIITTGGNIGELHTSKSAESQLTAKLLCDLFGIDSSRILQANRSKTTSQDALYTDSIFTALNLKKEIILATTASHMPRSVAVFKNRGFIVHPAPSDFFCERSPFSKFSDFLPHVDALWQSTMAIHEYYGLIGYKILGLI